MYRAGSNLATVALPPDILSIQEGFWFLFAVYGKKRAVERKRAVRAKVNAIPMLNREILEQNLDLAKHKNNIILSSINNSHFKT